MYTTAGVGTVDAGYQMEKSFHGTDNIVNMKRRLKIRHMIQIERNKVA